MTFLLIGSGVAGVGVLLMLVGFLRSHPFPDGSQRRWSSLMLGVAPLILGAVALSQPWGPMESADAAEPGNLWLVIDVSRSMLAVDAPGSRLGMAKTLSLRLLERLPATPIGVWAFAGEPALISPPTLDHEFLRERIEGLSIDSAPPAGSDWAAALSAVDERRGPDSVVVLLTDGGHETEKTADIGPQAIVAVGIGDAELGAEIPVGPQDEPLAANGQIVRDRLLEQPLRELARSTGGRYLSATNENVVDRILPRYRATNSTGQEPIDRFRWFLAPAVGFLALRIWRS